MDDLQKLFSAVADLDDIARAEYFGKHEVNPALCREVESLLRFDGGSSESLAKVIDTTLEEFLKSSDNRFCGPYELTSLVGEGGMGSVYLAQRKDGEVEIRVAVKLIRGAHATQSFIDRFLKERQILASLSHPGITRLLDAGHTKSGQPYLVMEYVDGTPIDEFCKDLSIDEKLRLFIPVCDAIAYLHRNLIIHRDLKPSNILIQGDRSPKVLDFGIAKILDEATAPAVTRERILTPDYASPEQVMGKAKTTATDVYSLGAVLYRLLSGRSPHTSDNPDSTIEEVICSAEPVQLSHLSRSVPRDLSLVVRKALRKEPSQRYPSVDALADDLRAILDSRPVKVRSGDAWYTARKFVRRHRLPVFAVAAAILSLAVGLSVARQEWSIEQRRFMELRHLSRSVLGFDDQLRELAGTTSVREKIVSVSIEYLDKLASEARNDLDLKLEIASGYMQTAEVQGVPVLPSLGHFKEAEASLAKASALIESVLATASKRVDALLLGAEVEEDRTIVANTMNDSAATLQHAQRGAAYADRLSKLANVTADQRKGIARIYMNIGQAQMNMHLYLDAAEQISRGIATARASGAEPAVTAQGLSTLANARRQAGDLEGALSAITEGRALSEKAHFSSDAMASSAMYAILWRQGVILGDEESVSLNRPKEALEAFEKAFNVVEHQASKDSRDVSFRERVGTAGQEYGDILRGSDAAAALAVYDRTLTRLREARISSSAQRQEAKVLAHSSYALRSLHRNPEARKRIDEAMTLLKSMGAKESIGGEWDHVLRALSDDELANGHPERAREILLNLQNKVLSLHPDLESDLVNANEMSRLYASLSLVDAQTGRTEEAASFQQKQIALWREWDRRLPGNSFVRRRLEAAAH